MKFRVLISFLIITCYVFGQDRVYQGEVPNVVFIMASDLNDWVGAMDGHPNAKTPNIDRLAKRGMLFTNAYVASPDKGPSRMAILSGMNPSTTGLYRGMMNMRSHIGSQQTLPQYFKDYGYTTYRSGNIGNPNSAPDAESWSFSYPSAKQHSPKFTMPDSFGSKVVASNRWQIAAIDGDDSKFDDSLVADWAIDQIKLEQEAPFFLAVGFSHARLPWVAPKKYFDLHPLESIRLPRVKDTDLNDVSDYAKSSKVARDSYQKHEQFSNIDTWKKKVQAYLASVSYLDAQVGRVVSALENSKYGRNTLIVFCSDNGFHLGEKQMWNRYSLWDEATKVPLIIAGGKKLGLPKGKKIEKPIGLVNIYPTVVSICDLPRNVNLDGDDMTKFIFDNSFEWKKPALTTISENNHALVSDKWKYILWSDGSEELYDRENDPDEWVNLADSEKFTPEKDKLSWYFPERVAETKKGKGGKGKGKKGKGKKGKGKGKKGKNKTQV